MRLQILTLQAATFLLLAAGASGQPATVTAIENEKLEIRADPTPTAIVPQGDAATLTATSEDGTNKVVGRVVKDIGEFWSAGLEIAAPWEEGQEEAELISIESLGPGANATLFVTFRNDLVPIGKVQLDDACERFNTALLANLQTQRKVAPGLGQIGRVGCPATMQEGAVWAETNEAGKCTIKNLRCIGGEWSQTTILALEAVLAEGCATVNKKLAKDYFAPPISLTQREPQSLGYTKQCWTSPSLLDDLEDLQANAASTSFADLLAEATRISASLPADEKKGTIFEDPKGWILKKSQEALAKVCLDYSQPPLAGFITITGSSTSCKDSTVIEKAKASNEKGWKEAAQFALSRSQFRQHFFTLRYSVSKDTLKYAAADTLTRQEQGIRNYSLAFDYSQFVKGTLFSAGGTAIHRFTSQPKSQVCDPHPGTSSEICTDIAIGSPTDEEYWVYRVEARRFLTPKGGLAGVARLTFRTDPDAFEPHLISYWLQNKTKGLNGGLDFGYNFRENELIYRVFIGTSFSIVPGEG